ncbi:hypothetical protein FH972_022554 [Carpinus fangiana]|uniref:Uncharacterized protein n=1 Tax=Carpinus fangiana TaxID=176857 RepID=A0A5N6KSZ4_9ROSI|nr:hypothetical protein FH972_022554 [Carpinus fangiana]
MACRFIIRWLVAAFLVLAITCFISFGRTGFAPVALLRPADSRLKSLTVAEQEEPNKEEVANNANAHNAIPPFPTYNPRRPPNAAQSLPFPKTNHTRALIVAHTKDEDVGWVYNLLIDDDKLDRIHYTVDDPHAPYKVPMNKGHEAMPYLTYIISRYDTLPDVSIFMHAHQFAWHNNDLLDSDAFRMVSRLSSPKVLREGYFNLRCHLDPGCPAHLHPSEVLEPDENTPEQQYIRGAWEQLFPTEPIPATLSAPCCGQFAVSRDKLLSISRTRYEEIRQWLINTDIPDHISGRIFEYVWHFLWTGRHEVCPDELICYCDAYGVCIDDRKYFQDWQLMRLELRENFEKLVVLLGTSKPNSRDREQARPMLDSLSQRNHWLREELQYRQQQSWDLGNDPQIRAKVAGRTWKAGDAHLSRTLMRPNEAAGNYDGMAPELFSLSESSNYSTFASDIDALGITRVFDDLRVSSLSDARNPLALLMSITWGHQLAGLVSSWRSMIPSLGAGHLMVCTVRGYGRFGHVTLKVTKDAEAVNVRIGQDDTHIQSGLLRLRKAVILQRERLRRAPDASYCRGPQHTCIHVMPLPAPLARLGRLSAKGQASKV